MSSQYNPHKSNVRLHADVHSMAENVANFTAGNRQKTLPNTEPQFFLCSFQINYPDADPEGSSKSTLVVCTLLTVVLHYFHLATFFWMLVEGTCLQTVVSATHAELNSL